MIAPYGYGFCLPVPPDEYWEYLCQLILNKKIKVKERLFGGDNLISPELELRKTVENSRYKNS